VSVHKREKKNLPKKGETQTSTVDTGGRGVFWEKGHEEEKIGGGYLRNKKEVLPKAGMLIPPEMG